MIVPTSASASSSLFRRMAGAVLLSALIWSTPVATQASAIGLRFFGTADLSSFGASPASTFDGSVTWDPLQVCGPGGGGEGDFPLAPLDDSPPCVTATLQINSISYNGFNLELSRLMLFPDGMALQLWFTPPVDLDGGSVPGLQLMELGLWQPYDPDHPVFPDIGQLPSDLSFLPRLTERSLVFLSQACVGFEGECVSSDSDTLTIVPEPSSVTLFLAGFSAAGIWARRRRKTLPAGRRCEPSQRGGLEISSPAKNTESTFAG